MEDKVRHVGEDQDKLVQIFLRQLELMEAYEGIEALNGLLLTSEFPVNLHDPKGQARLRSFAWYFVEEMAEAYDSAMVRGWYDPQTREEVADSMHFLVEWLLLGGIWPSLIRTFLPSQVRDGDILDALFYVGAQSDPSIKENFTMAIYRVGLACHTLKNKPWKKSKTPTDIYDFQKKAVDALKSFIAFCTMIDMTAEELFNLYFHKSEINKERQAGDY